MKDFLLFIDEVIWGFFEPLVGKPRTPEVKKVLVGWAPFGFYLQQAHTFYFVSESVQTDGVTEKLLLWQFLPRLEFRLFTS